MNISRDDLILELQRLPSNSEIEFRGEIILECGECESEMNDYATFKFNRVIFGNPSIIELHENR